MQLQIGGRSIFGVRIAGFFCLIVAEKIWDLPAAFWSVVSGRVSSLVHGENFLEMDHMRIGREVWNLTDYGQGLA